MVYLNQRNWCFLVNIRCKNLFEEKWRKIEKFENCSDRLRERKSFSRKFLAMEESVSKSDSSYYKEVIWKSVWKIASVKMVRFQKPMVTKTDLGDNPWKLSMNLSLKTLVEEIIFSQLVLYSTAHETNYDIALKNKQNGCLIGNDF